MAILLGFSDESGKDPKSRTLILATVVFSEPSCPLFEDRIRRWQADLPMRREPKLRKLISLGTRAQEALEIWSNIVRESDFHWFLTLIPWGAYGRTGPASSRVVETAAVVALNRFAEHLEVRESHGIIAFDHQIAEGTIPRQMELAKSLGRHPLLGHETSSWRRLLGQVAFVDSHGLPQIWVADGIAYLAHLRLNKGRWNRRLDELWAALRGKAWTNPSGVIIPWAVEVYPETVELLAEALSWLTE